MPPNKPSTRALDDLVDIIEKLQTRVNQISKHSSAFNIDGGIVAPTVAANADFLVAVTFAKQFDVAPIVVATPIAGSATTLRVSIASLTATGFSIILNSTAAGVRQATWLAYDVS